MAFCLCAHILDVSSVSYKGCTSSFGLVPALMTLFNLNALYLNTVTTGLRASVYEFWETQFILYHRVMGKYPNKACINKVQMQLALCSYDKSCNFSKYLLSIKQ